MNKSKGENQDHPSKVLIFPFTLFVILFAVFVYAYINHTTDTPRIRLVLMVKNEEIVLPRLLQSLPLEYIHGIVLCDTGSTDNTIAIAQAFFAKQKQRISFQLERLGEFVNFETSRNECKKRVRPIDNVGDNDWILLMDADFTVSVTGKDVQIPLYDVNTIQIHASTPLHPHNSLPMLIRATTFCNHCTYRLWTHEFLSCTQLHQTSGFYNDLYFLDHSDGKSRPEKSSRDARLLNQWLDQRGKLDAEKDIVPRALYYLARAQEDAGNWSLALDTYRRHAQVETMTNYQFYSLYRQAMIEMKRQQQDNTKQLENLLHAAFGTYDGIFRREPIYYLARLYRQQGDYDKCILYGTAGMNLPTVDHSRVPLFLEPIIYDWVLEEELAFCLYKKMHYQKALTIFEKIKWKYGHTLDKASQQRLDEEIQACRR